MTKEYVRKICRLPSLYAFMLALYLNIAGISVPERVSQYCDGFKGVFAILGMMMLGMGLPRIGTSKTVDIKFTCLALIAKLIVWPILILLVIYLDKTFLQLFDQEIYEVMFLFSIIPMADNTVTLAVLFKTNPEKASFTVILRVPLNEKTI